MFNLRAAAAALAGPPAAAAAGVVRQQQGSSDGGQPGGSRRGGGGRSPLIAMLPLETSSLTRVSRLLPSFPWMVRLDGLQLLRWCARVASSSQLMLAWGCCTLCCNQPLGSPLPLVAVLRMRMKLASPATAKNSVHSVRFFCQFSCR